VCSWSTAGAVALWHPGSPRASERGARKRGRHSPGAAGGGEEQGGGHEGGEEDGQEENGEDGDEEEDSDDDDGDDEASALVAVDAPIAVCRGPGLGSFGSSPGAGSGSSVPLLRCAFSGDGGRFLCAGGSGTAKGAPRSFLGNPVWLHDLQDQASGL
jgi:hypothetical protein